MRLPQLEPSQVIVIGVLIFLLSTVAEMWKGGYFD